MAKGNGGKNTVRTVEQLVRPVVEGMGLRLWDVRFEKEGPDWFLRIFIDRDTPLDTDTCEAVSRAIDPVIDAADPIDQSYYMEVGSPGLGRRLTRPEHFGPYVGQKIAARTRTARGRWRARCWPSPTASSLWKALPAPSPSPSRTQAL